MSELTYWGLIGPGWLLVAYLTVAQGLSALSYRLGVRIGAQEPAETVTEVGTAFWWGFAFGDLVVYIPLLAAGLIGLMAGTGWAPPVLAAALGITVYWPVVALSTVARARRMAGWTLRKEHQYWMVLPVITLWGLWGLYALLGA